MSNRIELVSDDGTIIWFHDVSNSDIPNWITAFFKTDSVRTIIVFDKVLLERG